MQQSRAYVGLFWLIALICSTAPTLLANDPPSKSIQYGQTINGSLQNTDARIKTGAFSDVYQFYGEAGDRVYVDLFSSVFDTYLSILSPTGQYTDNDDANGSKSHSQLVLSLPESGLYRITATSYNVGKTGGYVLSLNGSRAQPLVPMAYNERPNAAKKQAPSKVYGLFVGISDYDGRAPTLSYTSEDARVVRDALLAGVNMDHHDGIVLRDASATAAQFQRAIMQLAQEVTPNDVFIFFFSGHGNRVLKPRPDANDPDGYDETIELYDEALLDDDLDRLLSMIPAKKQIIVVDACFSGGLAKDVISRPNRMGLFSSEEDLESNVASNFRAGGYLSYFLAEGVQDARADLDRNGTITASELSEYVSMRFGQEVNIPAVLNTLTQNLALQRLVVEPGSFTAGEVLFAR